MRWVATFNAINNLATSVMPVITQTGQHDVVVTHDPTSQDPYMTASTYISIESLTKLHRTWDRGDAVYEVWPWQGSQHRVVRIIAEAWVTVNMAGQGEQDQLVEIKMKTFKHRNDSGMRLLDCSVLRDISDEYDEGFLTHRRSDPNSVAQNIDDDVMCRAIEPDSSSSNDDPPAGGASSRSAATASHRAANT